MPLGFLVMSEINYPGWKAYVNGKEVSILTGHYIFRVLPLPKGNHGVLLKFDPDSFRMGLIISVGSILFFLLFQFSVLVRKKDELVGSGMKLSQRASPMVIVIRNGVGKVHNARGRIKWLLKQWSIHTNRQHEMLD